MESNDQFGNLNSASPQSCSSLAMDIETDEKRSLSEGENKCELSLANKKKCLKNNEPSTSKLFKIKKEDIPISNDDIIDENPDLAGLGIVSYSHSIYEQSVINQVEKVIKNIEEESEDNKNFEQDELNFASDRPSVVNETVKEEQEYSSDDTVVDDDVNDKDYHVESDLDNESVVNEDDDARSINEYLDSDSDQSEEEEQETRSGARKRKSNKPINLKRNSKSKIGKNDPDDGDKKLYKKRIDEYRLFRAELNLDADEYENEIHVIKDELQIPKPIWDKLFTHQQESLEWLWGLHVNMQGGIIGDDMGLGKTIQLIAFFIALRTTNYHQVGHLYPSLGPVLLVCPATLMHQWVSEFHKWWPPFRVAILHSSGSFKSAEGKKKDPLINEIFESNGILITSYNGVCAYKKELTKLDWHYVVLDEGHQIRNPQALVTHCCKLFTTPHRIILSASPIQNDLCELWSLFDFIYPGKLGTLSTFSNTIAQPIHQGGFSNATELQIKVAYKCTLMLRDLIKPFLLLRTKNDIKMSLNLPPKNEQVLFCKLSDFQREIYLNYIQSGIVRKIKSGKTKLFAALINIRKICNHPFLFANSHYEDSSFDSKFFRDSGKMSVVIALLKLWYKQKQKVLMFTQSRKMLDLLEKFMAYKEYSYLRMDGTTSINSRHKIVKEFNTNPSVFIFLLTTKVGGIGLNLTGANRVIIYDPDWNPCTDMQARERCWRIGQNRNVIIYRLLTAGTVEEKIYHRQIFKHYLTNRVLKDPNYYRFFKLNDLKELFTLNNINQTSLMFSDSKVRFKSENSASGSKAKPDSSIALKKFSNQKTTKAKLLSSGSNLPKIPKIKIKEEDDEIDISKIEIKLSEERIKELRQQAKILSQKIAKEFSVKIEDKESTMESDEKFNISDLSKQATSSKILDCNKPGTSQPSTAEVKPVIEAILPEDIKIESSIKNVKKEKEKKSKEGVKFEDKRIKDFVKKEVLEENEEKEIKCKEGVKFEDKRIKYFVKKEVLEENEEKEIKCKEGVKFEGKRIKYLVKKEDFYEKMSRKKRKKHKKKEDYLLKSLLGNHIDVVLQHDKIENTKAPDHYYIEQEADNIVREAVEKLQVEFRILKERRQSRRLVDDDDEEPATVPLPKFGHTSKFKVGSASANASAKLVKTIKKRGRFSSTHTPQPATVYYYSTFNPIFPDELDFIRFMSDLRHFIVNDAKRPGRATTAELLENFKHRILPHQCAIMKSLVQNLCRFRRNKRGVGYWFLRSDYK